MLFDRTLYSGYSFAFAAFYLHSMGCGVYFMYLGLTTAYATYYHSNTVSRDTGAKYDDFKQLVSTVLYLGMAIPLLAFCGFAVLISAIPLFFDGI